MTLFFCFFYSFYLRWRFFFVFFPFLRSMLNNSFQSFQFIFQSFFLFRCQMSDDDEAIVSVVSLFLYKKKFCSSLHHSFEKSNEMGCKGSFINCVDQKIISKFIIILWMHQLHKYKFYQCLTNCVPQHTWRHILKIVWESGVTPYSWFCLQYSE